MFAVSNRGVIWLRFRSTLPDDGRWSDAGVVIEPPGKQHSQLLFASLSGTVNMLDGPWNQEDYGWEFTADVDSVRVSVLLQPSLDEDDEWLVAVVPVTVFAVLRRQRIGSAVEVVAQAVENVLQADGRIAAIRRVTEP